jgi:hypothetical protein
MAEVTQLVFSNYKCLNEVIISPISKICFLTGKNNVGKSSVLQMLKALPHKLREKPQVNLAEEAHPAKSHPSVAIRTEIPIPEYSKMLAEKDRKQRASDPVWKPSDAYKQFMASRPFREVTWHFEGRPALTNTHASIVGPTGSLISYAVGQTNKDTKLPPLNVFSKIASQYRTVSAKGILSYLGPKEAPLDPHLTGSSPLPLKAHCEALAEFLARPRFSLAAHRAAQMQPMAMQGDAGLKEDGVNLAQRLSFLKNNEPYIFNDIVRFMTSLLPGLGELATPYHTGKNFRLVWSPDRGVKIPLSQSGTGMEQLLMLAVILFAERHNGLILLEEPENHLHPGAQEHLVRTMIAELGERNAFVATHSPTILHSGDETTVVSLRQDISRQTTGQAVEGNEIADVLVELGVKASHFLLADILILVEGISAVGPVEAWLRSSEGLSALRDSVRVVVHSFNVSEVRNQDFRMDRLLQMNRNIIFFFDDDKNPETGMASAPHEDLETACKENDPPIAYVRISEGKRCLEGLFPAEAIKRALPRESEGWEYDSDSQKSPVAQFKEHAGRWSKSQWSRKVAETMLPDEIRAEPDIERLLTTVLGVAKQIHNGDGLPRFLGPVVMREPLSCRSSRCRAA